MATTAATSFEDTGLAASTVYYFRVVAFNDKGDAPVSASAAANTAKPAAPRVISVSASQVQLQFSGVSNYSSYETLRLQRSTSPAGPFTTMTTVSTQYTESWTDTTIVANTTYYYRVVSAAEGWTTLPSDTTQVLALSAASGVAAAA